MISTITTESDYWMPAEWEPQEAILFSWPHSNAHWNDFNLSQLDQKFAEICATISQNQMVHINLLEALTPRVGKALISQGANLNHIQFFHLGNDDVWCRDHGPIFVKHRTTKNRLITNWEFNGWGDKFSPYERDNDVPAKYAHARNLDILSPKMILEWGAIEVDGKGLLLTTEAVLKNPNRYASYSTKFHEN